MGMQGRTRLTARGAGLAVTGTVGTLAGTLLGVRVLAQVGTLLLLVVLAGLVWVLAETVDARRGRLRTVRRVPGWVQAGISATVTVEVTAAQRHRVDLLAVSERASAELSGGQRLRARVRRSTGRLELTYQIHPRRRGRWPLGPLEARRQDPFAVARWRGPLGGPVLVAVRPVVCPLDRAAWSASAEADQPAAGSRRPAADDAALREYLPGDDLRRVHWASSARRGTLVVRQDERAARRPVSVLLELSPLDEVTEWTISAGASIIVALADAGHAVRLLAGGGHATGDADTLLDHSVDLVRPPDEATAARWLATGLGDLSSAAQGAGPTGAGLVVTVLGPQGKDSLVRLGGTPGWALVTGAERDPEGATRTTAALVRAGWTAVTVSVGQDVATAWRRLGEGLGGGR